MSKVKFIQGSVWLKRSSAAAAFILTQNSAHTSFCSSAFPPPSVPLPPSSGLGSVHRRPPLILSPQRALMADGAGGTSAKKLGGSEPKKLHIWTRNPRIDTLFWMKSFFGYHLNSKFGTQALGSETVRGSLGSNSLPDFVGIHPAFCLRWFSILDCSAPMLFLVV